MRTRESMKKPFFAKFLEGQKTVQTTGKTRTEESNLITSPLKDLLVTLKYPSDWDEW